MAQRRAEYIGILLAALCFYAFCTDYISLYILLSVIFLPVLSLLMMCVSGSGLEAVIDNPDMTRAKIGDELRVYVKVKNPARLGGARVRMNLLIDYELEGKVHTERMRFVTERKEQMTACLVSAEHCGHITCRIEKLKLYDYLWLFAIPGKVSHAQCQFTVMPTLLDIEPLAERSYREDFESGIYAQNRPGRDYSEVYEIRSYREGDPISSIHHKLSAKREELVVREGSYPVGNRLMLITILPDWTASIEDCEKVLTSAFSVSSFLLANGIPHLAAWLSEDMPSGIMERHVGDEESFYEAADSIMTSGRDRDSREIDIAIEGVQRLICFAKNREDAEKILYTTAPDRISTTVYFTGENEENALEIPGIDIVCAEGKDQREVLSALVI